MKLSLPYRRDRRYLTGIDWIIGMLDQQSRATCGLGNPSLVVAEFDGPLDGAALAPRLRAFLAAHPVLAGRPHRDLLNLAPYWAPGRPADTAAIPFELLEQPPDLPPADLLALLARCVNRSFGRTHPHLAFTLIQLGRDRCCFAMAFSHWLFDARGAELFLTRLFAHLAGGPLEPIPCDPEPAHLDRWTERFQAGQRVNRHLLWLREGETASLPVPPRFTTAGARFAHLCFSPDQTRALVASAHREAGYLMLQPFLLACVLQAVHPLLSARAPRATEYVIPVSTDQRPPESAAAPIFFNHLSFLFYRVPCAATRDRAALAVALRQQMYQQVKAGLPQDVALVSPLMRILPLPALSRVARIPLRGKMASLAYAQLGECQVKAPPPWAGRLRNVFHLPRIPVPPGLGCVASQCQGRLNLVLSADATLISADELEQARATLERLPEEP